MRLSIETGSKLGQSSALLKRTTLPTLQLCSADGASRRGRTVVTDASPGLGGDEQGLTDASTGVQD